MHKDQITEALKNYRSYRYAVSQYERHKPYPNAGIANYSGMSGGSGATELFFAPNGRMADMGHLTLEDVLDYEMYKSAISDIDGALDILTDDERKVIRKKWMEGMSLNEIADNDIHSHVTIKRTHKRALNKLEKCFRFTPFIAPEIETINHVGGQHKNRVKRETTLF